MQLSTAISRMLLVLLVFFLPGVAYGQRSSSVQSDSVRDKSELRLGLRYTSDYVYMGRSDAVAAPYLTPSLGYFHKSGVFINGLLSYLTASEEGRIDLYALSGGYTYWGKRFATGLWVSGYFFDDLSYAVQAEMSTYLSTFAGYDFRWCILYADASVGFSESTDLFLGAEINRPFYALRNKLSLTPAFYLNAGTQQYYQEYYTYRSSETGSGKGKGHGGNGQHPGPVLTTVKVVASDKFQLLDYEAELQLIYRMQKVRLFTTATWAFPLNPATVVAGQVTYEEDLQNSFFWLAGVRLTL